MDSGYNFSHGWPSNIKVKIMHQLSRIFFKKKVLIYGLGLSGYSSFNFLKKKNHVRFFDDNYKKFKNKSLKEFLYPQKKF